MCTLTMLETIYKGVFVVGVSVMMGSLFSSSSVAMYILIGGFLATVAASIELYLFHCHRLKHGITGKSTLAAQPVTAPATAPTAQQPAAVNRAVRVLAGAPAAQRPSRRFSFFPFNRKQPASPMAAAVVKSSVIAEKLLQQPTRQPATAAPTAQTAARSNRTLSPGQSVAPRHSLFSFFSHHISSSPPAPAAQPVPSQKQPPSPSAAATKPVAPVSQRASFIQRLFHRQRALPVHEQRVHAIAAFVQKKTGATATPRATSIATAPPAAAAAPGMAASTVYSQSSRDQQSGQKQRAPALGIDALAKSIHLSLKKGFDKMMVREAALRSNWPAGIVDEQVEKQAKQLLRVRISILFLLVAILFVTIIVLHLFDWWMYGYWWQSLQFASVHFYLGLITVLVACFGFYAYHIRTILLRRRAQATFLVQRSAEEIRQTLATGQERKPVEGFQTDLDRLVALVETRGKMALGEVAGVFGISKAQAEEWGKILKEQNLLELFYPTVGDPELRWKK